MESPTSLIGILFEKAEHYAQTSAELYKLKAIDKSADVLSTLSARLTIVVFIVVFFLILSIGMALWIGETLGKSSYGFFIVAGFYALAGILFYVFRNTWVKEPIRNSIISQVFN